MKDQLATLDRISANIQSIIGENISLKKQLKELQVEKISLVEKLNQAQNQQNVAVSNVLLDSIVQDFEKNKVDTLDMKRKINEFVREIDKCINLLSKY